MVSVLMLMLSSAGCHASDTQRPGRCVTKSGQAVPCEALDRPDPHGPRPGSSKGRTRAVVEAPDPGERQDELERITGAESCDEVETEYARLHTLGPPCESADDCVWAEYLALTCGKAVHAVGHQRGQELEELDRLLGCGRMIPKCRLTRYDSALACQQGRCVAGPKGTDRP